MRAIKTEFNVNGFKIAVQVRKDDSSEFTKDEMDIHEAEYLLQRCIDSDLLNWRRVPNSIHCTRCEHTDTSVCNTCTESNSGTPTEWSEW